MKILFIGDVFGDVGRKILYDNIGRIKKEYGINLVIANGENAAHGRGITTKIYKEFMEAGINVITMGNHTWGNKDIFELLDNNANIVIPANYPNNPKQGYQTINYNGKKITIINLLGRVYMNNISLDCPFKMVDKILETVNSDYYIVDMHAEATSEKIALGLYLDGRVDAVLGTHTHVQTADERVLPKGTLYISDVGMTGPLNGVIGVDASIVINKFVKGVIEPNKTATGDAQFNAVVLDLNGTKNTITRIHFQFYSNIFLI